MEEVALQLEQRDVTGKAVKHLRKEGLVPAVIHDHGKDSIIVMGQFTEMTKAYQRAGKHHPVSVKAGKKEYIALIKSVDFDPKKHQIRHIVFNAVKANEKVTAEIPVQIVFDEGNDASPAERAGLIVLHQLEAVEVEAIPRELPDVLTFNGEKLVEVGDQATVTDLTIPSGVTVKTDPAQTLATVFEPSALAAANDAAGGTADEDVAAEDSVTGAEGGEASETESSATGDEKSKETKEAKKD
jgi:large subunit ribosomal protein L25